MQVALLLFRRAREREDLGVARVGGRVAERERRDRGRAEDLVHEAELELPEALPAELGIEVRGPQPLRPDLLAQRLPNLGKGTSGGAGNSLTPEKVSNLPDAIRIPVIESYNEALLPIFLYMVPLAIVTFLLLLFVQEKPLATRVEDEITAESLAEGQLVEMVDEEG